MSKLTKSYFSGYIFLDANQLKWFFTDFLVFFAAVPKKEEYYLKTIVDIKKLYSACKIGGIGVKIKNANLRK